jgi:hypothetical protein
MDMRKKIKQFFMMKVMLIYTLNRYTGEGFHFVSEHISADFEWIAGQRISLFLTG